MLSPITFFPFLLVTSAGSRYRSFADVLDAARSSPESVAYGSAGIGSTQHLAGELLSRMAGIHLRHVPHAGDGAAIRSLEAGDIPIAIAPPTEVLDDLRAGRLRALAVTGPRRLAGLPDVPTVAEHGVAGYDVRSWAGWMLPAGTPMAIVDRLNTEVRRLLRTAGVLQRPAHATGAG